MTTIVSTMKTLAPLSLLALLAGCATPNAGDAALKARFDAMIKAGFQANGPVTLARLDQDETQKFCSDPVLSVAKESAATRAALEKKNLDDVKWPSDGKYLGDWKKGEAIAQSGRGLTWTDGPEQANGGNCYNCHMIDQKEISHGTIGPSLWNYGKLRGVADPSSAASEAIVKYTWGKIWNAKAYNACSNMPRAGHMGILTEAQVKDVMALLLDPKSPVNQ
jgi:L-cysteine S-thiosulfotransferase